ncbi:MAG: hypothetical protein OHK0013_08440 [Sandaracinaceae bacterium]
MPTTRRAPWWAFALFLLSGTLAMPGRAGAQSAGRALGRAEQAFLDVDFEGTLSAAQEALREGGHTPAQLVRIYQLLGVSSAAMGDSERARDFFVRMLAIDPSADLDDTVPPRLRAPFLEARGIVTSRPERLGAEVGLARSQSAVHVALTDPFQLGRTIRVHARLEGTLEFSTREEAAQPVVFARLDGAATADRVEYWVELVDPFGNQILVLGSEFEPRIVGRATPSQVGGGGGGGGDVLSEPWLWIVIGVVVVGAGVTAGIVLGDQASQLQLRTGVSIGID